MIIYLILLLNHPVPVCYAGYAVVYLSLAILSWRDWRHAAAYAVGAVLAMTLAACAALAH